MSKYFKRREPTNRQIVEANEQWEISFWTHELNTTQDSLNRAIKEVGSDNGEIRKWLATARENR
ncbi:DUF3606 domain-containing protein [Erwinia sp. ErVv1]|uniref:DUF3606 domain-containing protein n=1 Tax=Erwinia sp. ErVv1 TaxID=1603299 RepID=UPI0008362F72|nr:DUF3606 domain-containing protein [Erwinia sp. ErVv1]